MKKVEYNYETGYPNQIMETLNRKIGAYKPRYPQIKIGITGRNPQIRFEEHLENFRWDRMIVIYITTSINYANILENWLVNQHYQDLVNKRAGGSSNLSKEGDNYLYILLG